MICFHENMNVSKLNVDPWMEWSAFLLPLHAALWVNRITVSEKLWSYVMEINLQFQKRVVGGRKKKLTASPIFHKLWALDWRGRGQWNQRKGKGLHRWSSRELNVFYRRGNDMDPTSTDCSTFSKFVYLLSAGNKWQKVCIQQSFWNFYPWRPYLELSEGESTHGTGLFARHVTHLLTSAKYMFKFQSLPLPFFFQYVWVAKTPE